MSLSFCDRSASTSGSRRLVSAVVNERIRHGGAFDGIVDFDRAVRDPDHPAQTLPAFDSGDYLHGNNEGNVAQGNVTPLALFRK